MRRGKGDTPRLIYSNYEFHFHFTIVASVVNQSWLASFSRVHYYKDKDKVLRVVVSLSF